LMVPKAAVLSDGDVSFALTIKAGHAHKVLFEPGLEERDWVEARPRGDESLAAIDQVIVSGHQDLKDQATVEVQGEPSDLDRLASASRPQAQPPTDGKPVSLQK